MKLMELAEKVKLAKEDTPDAKRLRTLVVNHGDATVKFDPYAESVVVEYTSEGGNIQTTTVGRYLRRRPGGDFLVEQLLEEFSGKVQAIMRYQQIADRFKLVTGAGIAEQYMIDGRDAGCMNGPKRNILTDFYRINEPRIKMLVLTQLDGVTRHGRALVWQLANGEWIMDRIYTDGNAWVRGMFAAYAADHNWLMSTGHVTGDYGQHGAYRAPGDPEDRLKNVDHVYFDGQIPSHGALPYLDTFGWGYKLPDREGWCRLVIEKSGAPGNTDRVGWHQTYVGSRGGPWTTLVLCKHCGCLTDPAVAHEQDCPGCGRREDEEAMYMAECEDCGADYEVPEGEIPDGWEHLPGGELVCEDCAGEHFCNHCEAYRDDKVADQDVRVNGDFVYRAVLCDGCAQNMRQELENVAARFDG